MKQILAKIFLFASLGSALFVFSTQAQEESSGDPGAISEPTEQVQEAAAEVVTTPKVITGTEDKLDSQDLVDKRLEYQDLLLLYIKQKLKSDEKYVDVYWEKINRDEYAEVKADVFKMKEMRPKKIKEYNEHMKSLSNDIMFSMEGSWKDYDLKKKNFPMADFQDGKSVRLMYLISERIFSQVPEALKKAYPKQFSLMNEKNFPASIAIPEDKARGINTKLIESSRKVNAMVHAKVKSFDDKFVKGLGVSSPVIEIKKVVFYVWEDGAYVKIGEI